MKIDGPFEWDAFRKDVADVEQNAGDWNEGLRGARARFLLSAKGQPLRPKVIRLPRTWAAVALAASVLLGFVGWTRYRQQAPVSFDTGAEHAVGQVGALLLSRGTDPMPVRFSDGSSLSMAAASLARVTETSPHGATVVLEGGSLRVAVIHRDATRWHVAAGPFTVMVTGTKFDVRWNAAEQTLALDLQEGSVTVLGPSLDPTGRRVSPGESLRVSVAPAREEAPRPPVGASSETASSPPMRDDAAKIGTN